MRADLFLFTHGFARSRTHAAELIKNGDVVFLDGSTTVQQMIPFLAEKRDITVITNNMRLDIPTLSG